MREFINYLSQIFTIFQTKKEEENEWNTLDKILERYE